MKLLLQLDNNTECIYINIAGLLIVDFFRIDSWKRVYYSACMRVNTVLFGVNDFLFFVFIIVLHNH